MGRMKELAIELEEAEMGLDFDNQNISDPNWWREQDAEMVKSEQEQIESDADIHALRTGGWL